MRPPGGFRPGQRPCGTGSFRFEGSDIFADWYGFTMPDFAGVAIPARVGRTVVDKTGLPGLYDIHLEYARELAAPVPGAAVPEPATKPSIVRAIEQQLGLKLTSARAALPVM